jgi:hypothetical protein
VAFFLPLNMELVVLVNSPVGPADQFLYTVVWDAYATLSSSHGQVLRHRAGLHYESHRGR